MNTEAENSGSHHISRTLCSSSHIPPGHPNVVGAISGYKAVVAQPSSLGILWHAHIWNLHAGVFRAFRRTSCTVSPDNSRRQVLLHFGRAFVSAGAVALSKRRQARLVKIEFQSVPSWSNQWVPRDYFDSCASRVPEEPLCLNDHDFANSPPFSNFISSLHFICVRQMKFVYTSFLHFYHVYLVIWKLTYTGAAGGFCTENVRLYEKHAGNFAIVAFTGYKSLSA